MRLGLIEAGLSAEKVEIVHSLTTQFAHVGGRTCPFDRRDSTAVRTTFPVSDGKETKNAAIETIAAF